MLRNRQLVFLIAFLSLSGCGVKGKPTPPDEPPSISYGETLYEKQKKETQIKSKKRFPKGSESQP